MPTLDRSHTQATPYEAALCYVAQGLPVIPVQPRGKRPVTRHGVKDATLDTAQIDAWWRRWPNANVGLAIPPGFVVVDVDSPQALGSLRERRLPEGARATTGRGIHLWFGVDADVEVRNRVGVLPGIDVRAPGGYVVAPPSVHPSGAIYRWEMALDPKWPTPCPPWLLELIFSVSPTSSTSTGRSDRSGRSPEDWHRAVSEAVPEGRRNQTLAEVAGLLFRRLPAAVAAEMAACWARQKMIPPLSEVEIRRTVSSIAGRERRRRIASRENG